MQHVWIFGRQEQFSTYEWIQQIFCGSTTERMLIGFLLQLQEGILRYR